MAEQRHAKTRASLRSAIVSWLETHELEQSTCENYVRYAERHIYPVFGEEPIGKVTTHVLERLYAELRRCGSRCGGRPFVEHRVEGAHECREVRHKRPPGRPPAAGDLVVVDESAMTDAAALAAIHARVDAAGAKLLLVGDHKQLAAVGAGGGMDLIASSGALVREQRPVVVSLTERRLADPDATIAALPPDRRPLPTVDAYDELLTRRRKAPASMSPASGTTAGGAS